MNKISKILKVTLCGCFMLTPFAFADDGERDALASIQSLSERDNLFLTPLAQKVSEQTGFTPFALWTGEMWADVSSSDIDTLYDSLFTFGFLQELSVVTGAKGAGEIGVSAFYYNRSKGGRLNDFSSSQGDISNILAGDSARVFELYYLNRVDTKFGEFILRVGQLSADEDFMGTDYSDILLNSSFGAIPNVAPTQLFSQYNVATAGLVVSHSFESFYTTFGVYNGNMGEDVSSNNGFDYSNAFDSVALWLQFSCDYELFDLNGRAIVGGNYHSSPDKANFDAIVGANNFYSFYFGIEQEILKNSYGEAVLGGFARVGFVPDRAASDNNFYADFGFNWFAPIPTRESDILALGVSVIENERSAREEFSHYEATLEVSYKMRVANSIFFQPDMQIFLNPTTPDGCSRTAYILGGRAEVVF